jgi:hypothetical protein
MGPTRGDTVAHVIGRPGFDALRRSRLELDRAQAELDAALREGHFYDENELGRVCDVVSQPRAWLKGAQGECRTARVLNSLPGNFVVFHDFHARSKDGRRNDWNFDHIVVGPPGVFVIDTKNHSVPLVESAETSPMTSGHVDAVRRQALTIKDWIVLSGIADINRVFVRGVVAYALDGVEVECPSERSVWVLPLGSLERKLRDEPHRLTLNQVARIRQLLAERRALTPVV